jgi:hypothetical protein
MRDFCQLAAIVNHVARVLAISATHFLLGFFRHRTARSPSFALIRLG